MLAHRRVTPIIVFFPCKSLTLTRMKHTVHQQHGPSDSNSLVDKLHTVLTNITDKLEDKSNVAAAASASSSAPDKRFESLSRQIKQLQKQRQPQPLIH